MQEQNKIQSFADEVYLKFRQKRYGINACTTAKNLLQLRYAHDMVQVLNYVDVSSPLVVDNRTKLSCKRIHTSIQHYIPANSNQSANPTTPIPINYSATFKIIVRVGTPEAIGLNIVEGSSIIKHFRFKGVDVEVTRSGTELPDKDLGNGESFFVKPITSDSITFSTPLAETEILIIKTIPL